MSNIGTRDALLKSIRNLQDKSWSQGAVQLATHASLTSATWTLGVISSLSHPLLRDQISDLAKRSAYSNPFFELPILEPSARHLGRGNVEFLFLSEKAGSHETLKYFAPVELSRTSFFRRPIIRIWSHKYAPLGHPLVDSNGLKETVNALIDCISSPHNNQPALLLFEDMPTNSAFGREFFGSSHLKNNVRQFLTYNRPALYPVAGKTYNETHVSGKRRRRLRKSMERLENRGRINFSRSHAVPDVKAKLNSFLELEASGWKGKRKTALLSSTATAEATRENVSNMAKAGQCEIFSMEINDRTVASIILYQSRGYYVPWKTAFDENFAQYSVGNLLTNHVNQILSSRPDFHGLDSLAAPENATARRFWPDTIELSSFAVGLGKEGPQLAKKLRDELMIQSKIKHSLKSLIRR